MVRLSLSTDVGKSVVDVAAAVQRVGNLCCSMVVVAVSRLKSQPFVNTRYLVDPASSHMLVSKIKPCMSKYKPNLVKPRMAH